MPSRAHPTTLLTTVPTTWIITRLPTLLIIAQAHTQCLDLPQPMLQNIEHVSIAVFEPVRRLIYGEEFASQLAAQCLEQLSRGCPLPDCPPLEI